MGEEEKRWIDRKQVGIGDTEDRRRGGQRGNEGGEGMTHLFPLMYPRINLIKYQIPWKYYGY